MNRSTLVVVLCHLLGNTQARIGTSGLDKHRELKNPFNKGKGPCDGVCNAYNKASCDFPVPDTCSAATSLGEPKKGCKKLCEKFDKFDCPVCLSPCSELITVNENTQDEGTLPNDWNSPYTPPLECGSGSDESCDCTTGLGIGSVIPDGCTEFPINGAGQVDEGFTMLTLPSGIQIGLRAQERFRGVEEVNPTPVVGVGASGKIGTYDVLTGGHPDDLSKAWWNIDWHVDLRPGGMKISDYQSDGGLKMTPSALVI